MYTVTLVGNKQGVYIDPRNYNAYVDYTKAENFADVNMEMSITLLSVVIITE